MEPSHAMPQLSVCHASEGCQELNNRHHLAMSQSYTGTVLSSACDNPAGKQRQLFPLPGKTGRQRQQKSKKQLVNLGVAPDISDPTAHGQSPLPSSAGGRLSPRPGIGNTVHRWSSATSSPAISQGLGAAHGDTTHHTTTHQGILKIFHTC